MTDDQAYQYSAMEVETRGPSSRVIVASFYGQGPPEVLSRASERSTGAAGGGAGLDGRGPVG